MIPGDALRAAGLDGVAIDACAGSLAGTYDHGELSDLRDEWE
jgi:hypothetical protein